MFKSNFEVEDPRMLEEKALLSRIMGRTPFEFRLTEYMKTVFGKCCRLSHELRMRREQFDIAKEMVDKELDIASIIKKMRKFMLLKNIMLAKN